jgi:hypothetical protein
VSSTASDLGVEYRFRSWWKVASDLGVEYRKRLIDILPEFNTCRTNPVEGENNAASGSNIRYTDPPIAFLRWIERVSSVTNQRLLDRSRLRMSRLSLTAIGIRVDVNSKQFIHLSVSGHDLQEIDGNEVCLVSISAGPNRYACSVTVLGSTCTCVKSEMLLALCRHQRFAIEEYCIRNGLVFKDRDDESALDDFNTNNFPTCFLLTQAEPFEPVSLRSSYALDQPIAYQYPIQSWCHLDTEMPRTVQSNDIDQTVNKDQPTCDHLRHNVHHNVHAGLAPAPPFSLRW